ncbi:hypothetical protein M5K25_015485 [Dendrobium thyrsiflorum]|uniref:Uncharacterized protein n=1 Tax=Dendrobium thyrsiflorum TaxID=117978 RepID=A0ABD0UR62_DENTH
MTTMKIKESCVENKHSATASGSSLSEEKYGFSRMSSAASYPVTSSPSHRRTSGPIRRAKGGWTTEEDETLRRAVELHKGRSWKKIAESIPDRTEVQCLHRWQKVINPELVKGSWTPLEDGVIINLVAKYGPTKWSVIAKSLPGRIGKQCRERWHNHLNPEIRKDSWTLEEEIELMKAHIKHGNKWAEIAKMIHGRTDNSIKNHWNSSLRKKLDYYLRTGKLPPVQGTCMFNTPQDAGNLGARQLIHCSNGGLETKVKNVPETQFSISSGPSIDSSRDVVVGEADSSVSADCDAQLPEIVPVYEQDASDSGVKYCKSIGKISQNEEPSNVSFLCYKPPRLEDLVISGPLSSSIAHLTPFINCKCSSEQSIESFLKDAARTFPNTPSIIKRKEAHTPLPSDTDTDTMQSNEIRVHECASNGALFTNEDDFNVSPPYRIWCKRKGTFRSVGKQLDFTLAERYSDGNAKDSSLAGNRSSWSPNATTVQALSMQRRRLVENSSGGNERDFSSITKMGVQQEDIFYEQPSYFNGFFEAITSFDSIRFRRNEHPKFFTNNPNHLSLSLSLSLSVMVVGGSRDDRLIVSFGEMLIDFVPTVSGVSLAEAPGIIKAPEGSPADVAIAVSRLGGRATFMGKLGDDEFGRMLTAILRENDVSDEGVTFDVGARTALAFVLVLIRRAKVFHYGSISLITDPCRSASAVDAFSFSQVDTTGAGDAYVGVLLSKLVDDMFVLQDEKKLREVLRFANACGAITTTKKEAIPENGGGGRHIIYSHYQEKKKKNGHISDFIP